VTGVLSLVDKQFMLTVGWSRKITKYDDSEGDVSISFFNFYTTRVLDHSIHRTS